MLNVQIVHIGRILHRICLQGVYIDGGNRVCSIYSGFYLPGETNLRAMAKCLTTNPRNKPCVTERAHGSVDAQDRDVGSRRSAPREDLQRDATAQ